MSLGPKVALTRLQPAELLLEHYPDENPEALEHLDFAISEFRGLVTAAQSLKRMRRRRMADGEWRTSPNKEERWQ